MRCYRLMAIAVFLVAVTQCRAAETTIYWTGDKDSDWAPVFLGNSNWSTGLGANIEYGMGPQKYDTLVFTCSASPQNYSSTNNNVASLRITDLLFNRSGVGIVGNALALNGNITASNATGTNTIGVGISLGADSDWSVASGGALVVSGNVTGGYNLAKSGGGTLTLNGTNTYTGTTTVAGGTLRVEGGNAIPDASVVTMADAPNTYLVLANDEEIGSIAGTGLTGGDVQFVEHTLTVGSNNVSTVYNGYLMGAGGLTKVGTGSLTLGGSNGSFSGLVNIEDGTLRLGSNSSASDDMLVTVDEGAEFDVNGKTANISDLSGMGTLSLGSGRLALHGGATSTFGGEITGTGGLTQSGTGKLKIRGTNSATGKTIIQSGSISVDSDARLGPVPASVVADQLTLDGGTLVHEDSPTLDLAAHRGITLGGSGGGICTEAGSVTQVDGVIAGAGNLAVTGGGTLKLRGSNTYTGKTTVTDSVLNFAGSAGLPAAPDNLVADHFTLDAGTIELEGSHTMLTISAYRGITLDAGGGTLSVLDVDSYATVNSVISGMGGLTTTGAGSVVLAAANTFTGPVHVAAGELHLNGVGVLPDAAALTVDDGALVEIYHDETIGSLAGQGDVNLWLGGLKVMGLADTTFGGRLTGSHELTKSGSGALTLSGLSSYTGRTIVNGGVLEIVNDSANLGSEPATFVADQLALSGGTLRFASAGEISFGPNRGLMIGSASGTFDLGSNAELEFQGDWTGSGNLAVTGGGRLTLAGDSTHTGRTLLTDSTLCIVGGGHSPAEPASYASNALTLDAGTLEFRDGLLLELPTNYGVTLAAGGGTLAAASDIALIQVCEKISGPGGLTLTGEGGVSLLAANTYAGETRIVGGTVSAKVAGALPATTALTVEGAGELWIVSADQTVASLAGAGLVAIQGQDLTVAGSAASTFSGELRYDGRLVHAGSGTLRLTGDSPTFTGRIALTGGVVEFAGVGQNLGADPEEVVSDLLTLDDGTLRCITPSLAVALAPTRGLTLGAGGGTLDTPADVSLEVPGPIAGDGMLHKTGPGTLVLSGDSSHTGKTTVNAGELRIEGDGALGTVPPGGACDQLILSGGATLGTAGGADVPTGYGITFAAGGGVLCPQAGATLGVAGGLFGYGSVTLDGEGVLELRGDGQPTGPMNLRAGVFRLAGNGEINSGTSITVDPAARLELSAAQSLVSCQAITNHGELSLVELSRVDTVSGLTNFGQLSMEGGVLEGAKVTNKLGGWIVAWGQSDAPVDNYGSLAVTGLLWTTAALRNYGTAEVGVGSELRGNAEVTNSATFALTGGTIGGTGTFVNGYGAAMDARGRIDADLTNFSDITLTGSLAVGGRFLNYGRLAMDSGRSLEQDGDLENYGTIELGRGAVFGSGELVNAPGGVIRGGGSVAAGLTNNGLVHSDAGLTMLLADLSGGNGFGGEIRIDDGSGVNVLGTLSNLGSVTLGGPNALLAGQSLANAGTLSGLGRVAAEVTNTGTILAQGGQLALAGALTNGATGMIEVADEAVLFAAQGLSANPGRIVLRGGTLDNNHGSTSNTGQITGYGTIRGQWLGNDGLLSVGGGDLDVLADFSNYGTASVQADCTLTCYGDANGPGSFGGPGTVVFLAGYSPGASPAQVAFDGNCDLTAAQWLVLELAGTARGAQYDGLDVDGELALGGRLHVELLDGFQPALGDRFDLLSWGRLTGQFEAVDLPDLPAGLVWDDGSLYRTGSLTVVPEPATISLLALAGVAGLAGRRRRRPAGFPRRGA